MKNKISNNPAWQSSLFAAVLTLTAITARADYQAAVLNDSPLAYYALDLTVDNTGTATDLTGNGNSSTYNNIYPVAGPTAYITHAASFSPGGQSIVDLSTGGNPGLLQFTGPTTLEAWVQPADSTSFGDIIGKGYDASTYQEITLRVNGPYGANYFGYFGGNAVSGGQQNTNWNYVVLANNGTNTSLYINGILIQSTPDTTGSVNFSDNWAIGNGTSAGNSRYFNGNICQVAIYNYGLTPSQILAHYYVGEINSYPSNSAPLVVTQPKPQATFIGGSATFSVTAVSALPTTNLWLKNGVPMTGRTNSTLTLNNVQSGDVANYSVVVGNINGTTNSIAVGLSLFTPAHLTWSASGNSGVWDTSSSANWINQLNNLQTVFNPGDQVLFDDTVGVPTTASVSGTVQPSVVAVNSSTNNFTINGSGTIGGASSLLKQGSSTLTVVSGGSFTGPVTIAGGAVYAGNNSFKSAASITITNNSTMDIAGGTYNTAQPVTVSGAGLNGEGAIFNSYNDYPGEVFNVTLAGDTTFGANARWDLVSGSQIGGAHNLKLDWGAGSGYGEWNSVTIGANVPAITVTNGNIGMKYMDSAFQNSGTVFNVSSNCQLIFWNGGFNGSIHVAGTAQVYLWASPSPVITGSTVTLEENAQWDSWGDSTDEPINSAFVLNGVARFLIGDHNMFYTNLISGPGGFVADSWNHQIVLSASNTYAGPTVIGNGPQVALTGDGSISHSSLIFFGGNSPYSTHVDVSGRNDLTWTLASGQTLAGIGSVNGSLVVSAGATISPAGTNTTIGFTTGANPVGALSAANDVTLNGTTIIKLAAGSNDMVQAGATLTYGGTLNLVNISGAPLTAGSSFQVFSAGTYAGSFANVTPSTPGSGVAWDLSQLSSGIVGVIAQPVISSVAASGGNLIFSGTGGTASGTYYVLATTNLTAAWIPVATNNYDGSGNFSVTNLIKPGVPQTYYRIKQ
jgi:autotransporter-associated beta strand protein